MGMPPLPAGWWNSATRRLPIHVGDLVPGQTWVLILTSQGSYFNVDTGPLPGQLAPPPPVVDGVTIPVSNEATTLSDVPADGATFLTITCDPRIGTFPDPTLPPSHPYLGYRVVVGTPYVNWELMTVHAIGPTSIDVERGPEVAALNSIPAGSPVTIEPQWWDAEPYFDSGNPPPLLYVPGDPTAAPARTTSWWSQVNASGARDPSFAAWSSRYWQSAPTPSVTSPLDDPSAPPVPRLWTTLCMLARTCDGTEIDSGLVYPYFPIPGPPSEDLQMVFTIEGALPSGFLFAHRAYLLQLPPTVELLPLPTSASDIVLAPAPLVPSVPPDPKYPPFAWVYPRSEWTHWVSSTGMNDADVFWPILLSQMRGPAIHGFHDITGHTYDPAHPEIPSDNPVLNYTLEDVPLASGLYTAATQIGHQLMRTTHEPNPIVDEIITMSTVDFSQPDTMIEVGGPGTSRVPVVGQQPWWELQFKQGVVRRANTTTVLATVPTRLKTDDVMILVAQSDGTGAPTAPDGWTLVPSVSGLNAYSAQPAVVHTGGLAGPTSPAIPPALPVIPAGSPTIIVAAIRYDWQMPTVPFTAVVESETLTVSGLGGYNSEIGGYVLNVGGTGVDHPPGAAVTLHGGASEGGLGNDQYVAVWWKLAEGPPPDADGVPGTSTETSASVSFPDGTQCSAQMVAVMADTLNPFSEISAGVPSLTRVDFPAAAFALTPADMVAVDGIIARQGYGLLMGDSYRVFGATLQHSDIRSGGWNPTTVEPVPTYRWDYVAAVAVGCALHIQVRGLRERPLYEKVDGHYAPTFLNRGALPPCAGGGTFISTDYKLGFGITRVSAATIATPQVLIRRENLRGNIGYLHAWIWSDTAVPDLVGYIYQRGPTPPGGTAPIINEVIWFTAIPGATDLYVEPPAAAFYSADNPYCVRVEKLPGGQGNGYLGLQVWSEEFCQEPATTGGYGLAAGFRYRYLPPAGGGAATAGPLQVSIVG